MQTALTKLLNIEYPMIVAPMFLVSNDQMVIEACNFGATAAIPSLNYRTSDELRKALKNIKSKTSKPVGINLIVNASNIYLKEHLKVCLDEGVDYFITSLGSPKEVINEAKRTGAKVFCDVVDEDYSKKVIDLGADALIAVNSGAGGHAGKIPASVLIPKLKRMSPIPVISAGGVATGEGILSMLALGADGLSVGTPFIACSESPVSKEYKEACIDYGADDIVMTTKLSGTPCTVINTPYVKKIGTDQNPFEKILSQNKQLKKYAKMLTHYKGMKMIENAAFSATYKTVWCAGPTLEFTEKVEPLKAIMERMWSEFEDAKNKLKEVL
jgi:nitronate monooxygenase